MSNSVWVVEEDETDSRCCIGVFKTRKAMIDALEKRYKDIEILYDGDGTPWYAQAWWSVKGFNSTHIFYTPLLLTRMKLDEWNDQ